MPDDARDKLEHFVARAQAAAPGENRDLRALIDDVGGRLQQVAAAASESDGV